MGNVYYKKSAFTLLEVVITTVLIGILAVFAMPNYFRAIERQQERNAVLQLQTLYTANATYAAQNRGAYLLGDYGSSFSPLADLNDSLQINFVCPTGKVCVYHDQSPANGYSTTIGWPTNGVWKIVFVNNQPLSNLNPCCQTQNCIVITNC